MRLHRLAILFVLAAAPAVAHHGWSTYDPDKQFTLDAELTSLNWTNPHGGATLNWKGERWVVTLAPITRMESRGLSKEMLKPGTKVRLVGQPRSDGTREMKIREISLAGKTYNLMF